MPTLGAEHLLSVAKAAGEGEMLGASIRAALPTFSSAKVLGLPRLLCSINLRTRKAPGKRQLPLSAECRDASRNWMHNLGPIGLHLWRLRTFSCNSRPSKTLMLALGKVIAPFAPGAVDNSHYTRGKVARSDSVMRYKARARQPWILHRAGAASACRGRLAKPSFSTPLLRQ